MATPTTPLLASAPHRNRSGRPTAGWRQGRSRFSCLNGRARRSGTQVTSATNREIAARLRITEGTVKNHVSSLPRKYGTPDRTRLALHLRDPGDRA
ncbi:response regulator transcription factor [Nonomuraea wenchangensis]|uniref:response regulator transcription factor n=1 Tax=Nonomuraea wenchangensis TaxID=568860 RepID=UPI003F4DE414